MLNVRGVLVGVDPLPYLHPHPCVRFRAGHFGLCSHVHNILRRVQEGQGFIFRASPPVLSTSSSACLLSLKLFLFIVLHNRFQWYFLYVTVRIVSSSPLHTKLSPQLI